MDPKTKREFSFTNPQDDPDLYPTPPKGFCYELNGDLTPIHDESKSNSNDNNKIEKIKNKK